MEHLTPVEFYTRKLVDLAFDFMPKLLAAILLLIVGWQVVRLMVKAVDKIMIRRRVDPSLRPFLHSTLSVTLKALLIVTAMSVAGIEMTSFVAIFGAAGLAIGMAFSGSLQNFAGGIMILMFKPYKVGDVIEAQGFIATVSEIQVFHTILNTGDNKTIIIPNGPLATDTLTNYSTAERRRVEWSFSVEYGSSVDLARAELKRLIEADNRIITDPEPTIVVSSLGDNAVVIMVRCWTVWQEYWNVYYDLNEKVYNTFNEKGISFPFPQMDIHLYKKN